MSAVLENLPQGSIFQVFATKQPKGIENEGVRGFGHVLGPTLSTTQTLPITLTLTLTITLTITLTQTFTLIRTTGAYKASMGQPQDGWSKGAFKGISRIHLINPEVELDIPFTLVSQPYQSKEDSQLTNPLEILERLIVRSARCHRPHPDWAMLHMRPWFTCVKC